jgi:hypothetical protein
MATRRMHAPVVLAVAGAVVLMAGASMMLIGVALQLGKSAGWQHLIMVGMALAEAGFAVGVVAVIVAVSPARRGRRARRPPGPAADGPAADPADPTDEWLSSLRAGGNVSPARSARESGGSSSAEPPGMADAGRALPGYADEGWRLDPATQQAIAAPAPEIHHPVRSMIVSRPTGRD